MKRFIHALTVLLAAVFILTACEDEDAQRIPEFGTGANVRVVINPEKSFLDFTDISNAVFEFTVYSENTDIEKAEFFFSYYDISEDSTYTEDVITVTQFPGTVTLTSAQLANMFDLSGVEHFGGADLFNFRTVATMTDGRTFSAANSTPNIIASAASTSFTTFFQTFVGGCASDLPTTGTWRSVSTENPFGASSRSGITLSAIDGQPGFYQLSDVSTGLYGAFGFNLDQPVQIEDVCNTLFIRSANGAQFNIVTSAAAGYGPGTYDPATESITLPWYDAGNGFGDVIILTRE